MSHLQSAMFIVASAPSASGESKDSEAEDASKAVVLKMCESAERLVDAAIVRARRHGLTMCEALLFHTRGLNARQKNSCRGRDAPPPVDESLVVAIEMRSEWVVSDGDEVTLRARAWDGRVVSLRRRVSAATTVSEVKVELAVRRCGCWLYLECCEWSLM